MRGRGVYLKGLCRSIGHGEVEYAWCCVGCKKRGGGGRDGVRHMPDGENHGLAGKGQERVGMGCLFMH